MSTMRMRLDPGSDWRGLALATGLIVVAALSFATHGLAPRIASSLAPSEPALPFILCSSPTAASGAEPILAAAQRPRPVARVVSSERLAHMPGKRVTMAIVDFPPGSHSPPHRHGGSVSVYVLSGTIYSQLEGGPMGDFKPGDTFFEPLGIIHLASGNNGTEAAQILAVFVHDEGATLTTYLE